MTRKVDLVQRFSNLLHHHLPSGENVLAKGMRHILTSPSQLIRPQLVYATNQAFHGSLDHADGAALAIEYIHSFSLIHDDLPDMDDATTRRGAPCAHRLYGNGQAILIGDALLCEAFQYILNDSNTPSIQRLMLKALSKASGYQGMTLGQSLDISPPNDLPAWIKCYQLKTGALFSAACILGALSAGMDEFKYLLKLKRIGLKLGLCFQLQDDLLDENELPSGKDKHLDQNNLIRWLGTKDTESLYNEEQSQCMSMIQSLPNPQPLITLSNTIFSRLCLTNAKN
ncbi:MAG: hypothetical protein CMF41_03355 [Legionellales bacterium]|nr:hypothetical protein [Legionellales bacterium]